MQGANEQGLRARKRLATAAAIEEAAVRLVLDHGYADVTVDEICDAAGISRRTFFNYFATKEAAVLGPEAEQPDPEAAARFQAQPSRDLVSDVVEIAVTTHDKTTTSDELLSARMDLMGVDPNLLQAQLARYDRLDEGLIRLVVEHFAQYPQTRRLADTLIPEDEARLVVSMAGAAMRYSMHLWLEGGRGAGRTELTLASVRLLRRLFADP